MSDAIAQAIDETRRMFAQSVGFADSNNIIRHFIASLPKPETPYEQAIIYRKLVGME